MKEEEKKLITEEAIRQKHPDVTGFVARTELIHSDPKFGHKNGIGVTGISPSDLKKFGNGDNIFDNINAAIETDKLSFERFDNSIDKMHVYFLRGYNVAENMSGDADKIAERINNKAAKTDVFATTISTEESDLREAISPSVSVPEGGVGKSVAETIYQHLESGNILNLDATKSPFVNIVLSELTNGRP